MIMARAHASMRTIEAGIAVGMIATPTGQ